VSGVVSDSTGIPILGARVSIAGTALAAITDDRGEFRLAGVSQGVTELDARRLGFVPMKRVIRIFTKESLNRFQLIMAPLPRTLSPVLVQANHVEYRGRLAGYYQRMQRRSGGYFVSRDEIDRKSFQTLSHLLTSVPGINAFTLRSGGGTVRMRGMGCRPMVWLDGVPMPAGEVDLDAFPASTLHGIELYLGSTATPAEFVRNDGNSSCGTILLWSRGRDTDPLAQARATKVDLDSLLESLQVFSADQVEKPAELAGRRPLDVTYPPELFAAGVGGSVLVEFVVDVTGRVEGDTYSTVSSSHPLFSQAVKRAVQDMTYTPAMKDGGPVRQAVQQPFTFVPGLRKAAQASK
jgi:TonB family protein